MARDMTPVLKRCRALGLEPGFLGLDKKSNRNVRAGRKPSEYGLQLKEKQKAKFIYGVLEKPFRNNFARAQKLRYGTPERRTGKCAYEDFVLPDLERGRVRTSRIDYDDRRERVCMQTEAYESYDRRERNGNRKRGVQRLQDRKSVV